MSTNGYTKDTLDQMVAGAAALAMKHLPKYAPDSIARITSVLVNQALDQEDFRLYNALVEHAPAAT